MSKLSLIKRNKNNHFRKKSTLRRRNTRRKYSSKKSKSKNGGGGGVSSKLLEKPKKQWNPPMFFKTQHNDEMHCTEIVPHIKWQDMMYESLRIFLTKDDILDRFKFKKPDELRELQEKYLRFYQDKKDWLVKQYCIFINIPPDKSKMRFIIEPDQTEVHRLTSMTDDEILFFSWLTNLEYKNAAENKRRNKFWRNITAPNPDEYDSPASSRDYSEGVKDPLLGDAHFADV